ncbi:LRR domain containing protein [Trema orientale]|uniref:LRR domain containing protein n=1 Tax=Trema orientale TaxID=63057 RepID=A0A2P5EPP4_TREOI|nr:LRR domain containing protein [Trema orientale]
MFDRLRSLTVAIRLNEENNPVRRDVTAVVKRCPHVHKLCLDLPVVMLPDHLCRFSRNLMKLTLRRTSLEDDPMSVLEKLPDLRILRLDEDAFKGSKTICPRSRSLDIYHCDQLRALPDGLKDITCLSELEISTGNNGNLKKRLSIGGEEFYKVEHVPLLRIF